MNVTLNEYFYPSIDEYQEIICLIHFASIVNKIECSDVELSKNSWDKPCLFF